MSSLKLHNCMAAVAESFAELSKCVRVKVGAVAVRDGRILATGVNGTASGYYNCDTLFDKDNFDCDEHHKFAEEYELHAEQNLISFAAKEGISLRGADIYCTHHPCWTCLKLLSVCGISKIYYINNYDRMNENDIQRVYDYLKHVNIKIERLYF